MSRSKRHLISAGLIGLAALAASPTFAADQLQQQLGANGGALVRGGAPLPEFHLDFLVDQPARGLLRQPGGTDNLEIALTSPDNGVFRFLFSPRPQFGISLDRGTGANRGYAGLTWNLFDSSTIFGNIGLAGTFDTGSTVLNDPARRLTGEPLTLHGAVELGYHLGEQHSLSLRVEEGRAPDLKPSGETSDKLRLQYGLKF